jgi:hypothetical protein
MPEIVPENFSTTLLCMYFALAREGKLDAMHPRVYFSRNRGESRGWGELFKLDRGTEVWMCRGLEKTLAGLDVRVTGEHLRAYGQLKPDIWIQDGNHAIIIENKHGLRNAGQQRSYLDVLGVSQLRTPKRAFLYCVPQAFLPSETAEWWEFVKGRTANDNVVRGIIPWDDEFAEFLCDTLPVPEWFRNKLPNRINEGKYLDIGQNFWA